jgi:uncharacterized membrane protein
MNAADRLPQDDPRLPEIDRLRGLVMVVMVLDHCRDFFDADALRFSPTDLSRTYPFLFFTRFITHFCAPTFALLAGVGAFLYGARRNDPRELSVFLATRGLWLILLDAVVISPIWGGPGKIELGTLWAIGCGLLALAALSRLPAPIVGWIGAAIIAGHNLLDGVHADDLGVFGPWWRLLHEKGPLPLGLPGDVQYPALPWIGVVALGYGLGPLFHKERAVRDKQLRRWGAAALAVFLALRASNLYGDPRPWTIQDTPLFNLLSFLNVYKYPPSLLYLLATLGGAALVLPLLERLKGFAGRMLTIFGRTPLLFYVLHLYMAVAGGLALAKWQGYSLSDIGRFAQSGAPPANLGAGLAGAYVAWVVVVAALYPVCRWFAGVKSRRRDLWWLSYL